MSRRHYAIHRWVGAIVGIQLFAWTLGGFMFSIHDIDWVHGDETRNFDVDRVIDLESVRLSPTEAVSRVLGATEVEHVTVRLLLGAPVYERAKKKA